MFEPLNLAASCRDCNIAKLEQHVLTSSKIPIGYPRVAARFKIVHPHLDDWDAEIRKVGTLFIPMTEKGNHTIRVCNLTRLVLRVVEADGLAIPDWVEEAMESVVGDPRAKAQATRRLIARRIGVAEAQQGA